MLDLRVETLEWKKKPSTGKPPQARGYHSATFTDNRLFIIGGADAQTVFSDISVLDLGIYSLLSSPAYVANNSATK